MLYVLGDATEDHTLIQAGIERASGLIAALTHDRDNLYVTLSARSLNAKARIVSKVVEPEAAAKMIRAGANATVSPNTIGGRRMASELIRPTVVEFLDQMLRDKERNLRFAEVTIPSDSRFVGRALKELPTRHETNTLVVAMRTVAGQLQYNPPGEAKIEAGIVIVVLGQADDVVKLRELVGDRSPVARAG
jgi:voltage-gated potassium channel